MPGTPTPWRADRGGVATMQATQRRQAAGENQQYQVITDPTGATGDPAHGHATAVIGQLAPITGLAGFGVAVWVGSWVQVGGVPVWVTAGLTAPWAATTEPIQYTKDANRVVRLRGSFTTLGTNNTTAFTLPAGFRPAQFMACPAVANPLSAPAITEVNISASGALNPFWATLPTALSVDGISFLAEN